MKFFRASCDASTKKLYCAVSARDGRTHISQLTRMPRICIRSTPAIFVSVFVLRRYPWGERSEARRGCSRDEMSHVATFIKLLGSAHVDVHLTVLWLHTSYTTASRIPNTITSAHHVAERDHHSDKLAAATYPSFHMVRFTVEHFRCCSDMASLYCSSAAARVVLEAASAREGRYRGCRGL